MIIKKHISGFESGNNKIDNVWCNGANYAISRKKKFKYST